MFRPSPPEIEGYCYALCKRFLLFSLKNMAVDHVSVNQKYFESLSIQAGCLYTMLTIYNFFSARDDYNIDKEAYHSLTISSDGNISRFFPTIYKASCKLDVTNFPFDDQVSLFERTSVIYAKP